MAWPLRLSLPDARRTDYAAQHEGIEIEILLPLTIQLISGAVGGNIAGKSQSQGKVTIEDLALLNRLNPDQALKAGAPVTLIRPGK